MAGQDESTKRPQIVKEETRIYDADGSTQYLDFEEEVVTARQRKPLMHYIERTPSGISEDGAVTTGLNLLMGDEDVYSPDGELLHRGGPAGWAQLIWKQMTDANSDYSEYFMSSNNVYANNFIINYHSYTAPLPFSIEHYVTNCSFSKSKTGAYETANLTLKMPYQLALSLFAEDDAQPQPGGYILIKTRPPTDFEEILKTTSPENIENALHFGVVTDLSYNIETDDTGNLICTIDLGASSFIHNLIYGEYRFTFLNSQDEVVMQDEQGKQIREVRQEGYGSREYYKNIDDFLAFIKKEVAAATGAFDLGQSLRNFVQQFAYPMLPISLHSEPMNSQALNKLLLTPGATFEETIANLKLYVPEPIINGLLYGLADLAQLAGDEQLGFGGDPFTQFWDPENPTRNSFEKWISNGFTNPDEAYAETRYARGDVVGEAVFLRQTTKVQPKYELQLRDIIHVATKRDDLPPSSELYGTMPVTTEAFQDLNRIRNLGAKSLTVWGLFQGTFQIDSQLIEFYPTMVPLLDSDIKYFEKMQGKIANPVKLIHKKLGGIPTLILRLKPMHPTVSIDHVSIDNEYLRKHQFGSPSPLPPPCYITSSEIVGMNVKDNSFGKIMSSDTIEMGEFEQNYDDEVTETLDLSGPNGVLGRTMDTRMGPANFSRTMKIGGGKTDLTKVSAEGAKPIIPVQIRKHQIKGMRFSQNDASRINATFMNLPGVKNMSSRVKYGIMSDPVINNTAALKHGLRMYESTYPYFELSAFQGQKHSRGDDMGTFFALAADNYTDMTRFKTTALAERAYMIYGDEQKYFSGNLVCTSLIPQNIYPGCWAEVFLQEPTGNKIKDQHSTLHIYVDSVSHDYFTDIFDGNVSVTTRIGFSRGSYGAIAPNFPTVRAAIPDHRAAVGSRTKQSGVTPVRLQQQSWGSKIFEAMMGADSPISGGKRVKNPNEPDLPAARSHRGEQTTQIKTVEITQEFLIQLRDKGVITQADYIILKGLKRIPRDDFKELTDLLNLAEDIEIEDDATNPDADDYDFSDMYEQQEANRASAEAKEGETDKAKIVQKQKAIDARDASSGALPPGVTQETENIQQTQETRPRNADGETPLNPDDVQTNRQEIATTQEGAREEVREGDLDTLAGTSADETRRIEQLAELRATIIARQGEFWQDEKFGVAIAGDTDGDGLTDEEEQIIGTSIDRANTDYDVFSDFEEFVDHEIDDGVGEVTGFSETGKLPEDDRDNDVLIDSYERTLGLDTTRVDTDGDGLDDYEEVRLRTNPLVHNPTEAPNSSRDFYTNTISWDEYVETIEVPANVRYLVATGQMTPDGELIEEEE